MAPLSAKTETASEWMQQDQNLIAPTYGKIPLAFVKGEGSWLWDAEGRQYLDFGSGIAVNALGHAHPALLAAVQEQMACYMHLSNLFPNAAQLAAAQIILKLTGMDQKQGRVFFCNSGTEANEGALKFARKYFARQDQPQRTQVITFEKSFHGRTYGALSATGQPALQQGFGPMPQGFVHVPWNDVNALQQAVHSQTCAIMLEPIAAEGGILKVSPQMTEAIVELKKQWGLLVIVDEVQVGWGRCGSITGTQRYGLPADLMTFSKALGGGLPLGAVAMSGEVASWLRPGDHGSTFGGNPVACAAAKAFLQEISQPGFLAQIQKTSEHLEQGLRTLMNSFSFLTEWRGDGLIQGLVCEKPLPDVMKACREQGLIVLRAGTNVLRFLPPLNISLEEVDEALLRLEKALAFV